MDSLVSISSIVKEHKKSYSNISNKLKKYNISIIFKDGKKYISSNDLPKILSNYTNRVSNDSRVIELENKLYTPLTVNHKKEIEQIIKAVKKLNLENEVVSYKSISKECNNISSEKVRILSMVYYYLLKDIYDINIYEMKSK